MTIAGLILIGSVGALGALFVLKHVECKMQRRIVLARVRTALDVRLARVSSRCAELCSRAHIKGCALRVYGTITHTFARLTASIAKRIEWRARTVAHKGAKIKQKATDTRENEYLKNVREHKESLDISTLAQETKL